MRFRFLTLETGVLAVTAVVLLTSRCWAHWYDLGPSKDEWGLKYDGEVSAAAGEQAAHRVLQRVGPAAARRLRTR